MTAPRSPRPCQDHRQAYQDKRRPAAPLGEPPTQPRPPRHQDTRHIISSGGRERYNEARGPLLGPPWLACGPQTAARPAQNACLLTRFVAWVGPGPGTARRRRRQANQRARPGTAAARTGRGQKRAYRTAFRGQRAERRRADFRFLSGGTRPRGRTDARRRRRARAADTRTKASAQSHKPDRPQPAQTARDRTRPGPANAPTIAVDHRRVAGRYGGHGDARAREGDSHYLSRARFPTALRGRRGIPFCASAAVPTHGDGDGAPLRGSPRRRRGGSARAKHAPRRGAALAL